MRVRVLPGTMLDDNHRQYHPGDELEMEAAEAAARIEAGQVAAVTAMEPGDLARIIATLNPDNPALWTAAGPPTTEALSRAAGASVTAKQRDAAWYLYKEWNQ